LQAQRLITPYLSAQQNKVAALAFMGKILAGAIIMYSTE
jgi:hypothetical protein